MLANPVVDKTISGFRHPLLSIKNSRPKWHLWLF